MERMGLLALQVSGRVVIRIERIVFKIVSDNHLTGDRLHIDLGIGRKNLDRGLQMLGIERSGGRVESLLDARFNLELQRETGRRCLSTLSLDVANNVPTVIFIRIRIGSLRFATMTFNRFRAEVNAMRGGVRRRREWNGGVRARLGARVGNNA